MTVLAQRCDARRERDPGVLDHTSELHFLLVEDSATDSELVRALLEEEFPNGAVDVAANLELALHHLAESDYDLVLADLTLPDAEGETVVRAERGAFPQTALMVLTGRVDGTLALWSLAEGAQDYLVKGQHDGPRLAEALLHGLQRSRAEQVTHARLVSALALQSEAAEQLRELDRAKNDFVATASHELRTPLTSIVAYAEMLQEEAGLSTRQVGFVDAIVRNAGRLTALTEDLLLLSGLSSPQRAAAMGEVDLAEVVTAAQEVVRTLATGKHLDVVLELPDHPLLVTGDAGQLERVVLNLMGNAIKFTEDAGTVTCRLTGSTSEVLLQVADTGIGIPPAEQQELFTRFFRGSGARHRAIPGSGLGLHIVGALVEKHDGAVTVESVPGRGSTFTVRLPRRRARPAGRRTR